MIISLLVTCSPQKEPINLLLVTVPIKKYWYFVSRYCPLKKSND
jgi:hypothetical protein